MKKIIIPLLLAVMALGNLQAQDTVWQKPGPLSNYYNSNWIDTTNRYVGATGSIPLAHTIARRFVADNDTLQVYGIAAMMVNHYAFDFWPSPDCPDLETLLNKLYPDDPSFDHCEESLLLFQYHGSPTPTMQQLGDSLKVHILHTPVSYWMISGSPLMCRFDTFPKPVYERFYSTPQTVYDTFYAGFTQTEGGFSPVDSIIWHDTRPQFGCLCFGPADAGLWPVIGEGVAAYRQDSIDAPHTWLFNENCTPCSYFIFPILTPPDTTDINPGDTTVVNPNDTVSPGDTTGVGIRGLDLLYRYTAVMPNPARHRATVTSSFGLTQIDLYDARGRLLKSFPASGLKADLDLSPFPPGTYLLRILTPAGQTTKKLLLQ